MRHGWCQWLAIASLALWLAGAANAQPCSEPLALRTAQRIEPQAATGAAPVATTARSSVTLPDPLAVAERDGTHTVRYRIDVSVCAAHPAAALWLFRVGAPYTIRSVDGAPVRPLGAATKLELQNVLGRWDSGLEAVYNGRLPALFALPPGTRAVEVTLLGAAYVPYGLIRAQAGPTNLMLPLQATELARFLAFADAASGVVMVLGALALVLWWQRSSDRTLLWLAIACALWGLRGLAYFSAEVPIPPLMFEQLNPLNVLLAQAALCASVLSLLDAFTPRLQRALWGATLTGVTLLVISVASGIGVLGTRALTFVLAFAMLVALTLGVWRWRDRLPGWRAATLVGSLLALTGCALHDLLIVTGHRPPDSPSFVFWGFVVLLIGFAAMSGQYVVVTLNRAERSNEALEERVRAKTQELEQSYARLRDNEREVARTQERERLLRDMHDGLGAHLMTALRGVERGALGPQQIAQSLQDSMDELRLLMDSADMGHYLPGALAAWRNRWDARLASVGVTLHWRVDDALDRVQLSGDTALQVMRILQEAAANIVKHSQARNMALDARVLVTPDGEQLAINILDDGVGLPDAAVRTGARGLNNMRHRAAQVGAQLQVLARPAPQRGTEVALRLPLT